MSKSFNYIIIVSLFLISVVGYWAAYEYVMYPRRVKEAVASAVAEKDSVREFNMIKKDIARKTHLSDSTQRQIFRYIAEASNRYNLPPGLLHAIISIESNYTFWVTHAPVTVKGKSTNAIGMGGVIWEYWSDYLIKENVAHVKSDLYLPRNNIYATAAILRYILNDSKKNLTPDNAIPYIISRYYGKYDKGYHAKFVSTTSELWASRMSYTLTSN